MIRPTTAIAGTCILLSTTFASAEPILKPHKYYGPIPQSSLALRVGVFDGAENTEMLEYLDGRVQVFGDPISEDFGASPVLDLTYVHKPHPQFGLRLNASYSRLRSTGSGIIVPQADEVPDTLLLPALEYDREFNVDLFSLEASGVYFFSNAAVQQFQPYIGAGFTVGFPHQIYTESRVDTDTGEPLGTQIDLDQWNVSAGVHALLGAHYYFTNAFAVTGEGRVQLLEGRFEQLQVINEFGEPENVTFVVDFTGFYFSLGVLWAF